MIRPRQRIRGQRSGQGREQELRDQAEAVIRPRQRLSGKRSCIGRDYEVSDQFRD